MFVSFYNLSSWGVTAACPFALQGLSPSLRVSVPFWRPLVPSQAWGPPLRAGIGVGGTAQPVWE